MENDSSKQGTIDHSKQRVLGDEFDYLETDPSIDFDTKMEFALMLCEDVFYDGDKPYDLIQNGELKRTKPDGHGLIKHWYLPKAFPDINPEQCRQIRESYEDYDGKYFPDMMSYYENGDRILLRAEQGVVWELPKSLNPYAVVGMSTCTAVVGETDDKLVVAHVDFSEKESLRQTMELLRTRGVASERIYAVASVGETQEEHNAGLGDWRTSERATSVADYEAMGIPPENIIVFQYSHKKVDDERRIYDSHNLARVLVTKDGIAKWVFDTRTTHLGYLEKSMDSARDSLETRQFEMLGR
jgi:hypothetical protein